MALIVQKFGGSSVADIDRIRNVANRVAEYRHRGQNGHPIGFVIYCLMKDIQLWILFSIRLRNRAQH